MRVAVVGAGIVGLSAARYLSSRGHRVDVFEQAQLGHRRGSSHGLRRIVRRAYPDAFYAEKMADAYPLWQDLERESGREILHEVGLAYFGPTESPGVQAVVRAMSDLEIPHRLDDHRSVGEVFPVLQMARGEISVFTPEAGFVRADRALAASRDLAEANGTRFYFESRVCRDQLNREYDVWVAATGAWIADWVQLPLQNTLQTYVHFDAEIAGPVWIHDDADCVYGFPSDEDGLRAAQHIPGPVLNDLDEPRREDQQSIELVRRTLSELFGVDAPIRDSGTCVYANLPNEDFSIGRIGDKGFYASACSGHGFKFGPYIGRLLADFVDGHDIPERHARWGSLSASP
jgi:sarcosine oxidase